MSDTEWAAGQVMAVPLAPVEPPAGGWPESDLPHVTHAGEIRLGAMRLRVYQLSTGQRVIDAEDMEAMFAGLADGPDEPGETAK